MKLGKRGRGDLGPHRFRQGDIVMLSRADPLSEKPIEAIISERRRNSIKIVLPELPSDIRKDTYCSSGPGGQSVNTTYSAVRLTHIPTGVVAQCQDQKSQLKNYDKALKVLRSRIYEIELQKKLEEDAKHRKTMVSSGDRSAKIRTYNYPQGRVTEHRIGLTKYNLQATMGGDIQEFIDELQLAENAEKLKVGTTNE